MSGFPSFLPSTMANFLQQRVQTFRAPDDVLCMACRDLQVQNESNSPQQTTQSLTKLSKEAESSIAL